jgi:hypothetical protein
LGISLDTLGSVNYDINVPHTRRYVWRDDEYNIRFMPTYLPDVKAMVVNLSHRELRFLVAPKNPF